MNRFEVAIDEMGDLSHKEVLSLTITRSNSVVTSRSLDVARFGQLVTWWNALSHLERNTRADYCRLHGHAYVDGPFHNVVCKRCLTSYGR
jgi:hypothetical protein